MVMMMIFSRFFKGVRGGVIYELMEVGASIEMMLHPHRWVSKKAICQIFIL